jgi:hypothetical protein
MLKQSVHLCGEGGRGGSTAERHGARLVDRLGLQARPLRARHRGLAEVEDGLGHGGRAEGRQGRGGAGRGLRLVVEEEARGGGSRRRTRRAEGEAWRLLLLVHGAGECCRSRGLLGRHHLGHRRLRLLLELRRLILGPARTRLGSGRRLSRAKEEDTGRRTLARRLRLAAAARRVRGCN